MVKDYDFSESEHFNMVIHALYEGIPFEDVVQMMDMTPKQIRFIRRIFSERSMIEDPRFQ